MQPTNDCTLFLQKQICKIPQKFPTKWKFLQNGVVLDSGDQITRVGLGRDTKKWTWALLKIHINAGKDVAIGIHSQFDSQSPEQTLAILFSIEWWNLPIPRPLRYSKSLRGCSSVMETLEMEVLRIDMTGRHSSTDKAHHPPSIRLGWVYNTRDPGPGRNQVLCSSWGWGEVAHQRLHGPRNWISNTRTLASYSTQGSYFDLAVPSKIYLLTFDL